MSLIQGIGIAKLGSGGIPLLPNTGKQIFEATPSQVSFTVTNFILSIFAIYINGSLQTFGYSTVGNIVTFTTPFYGGEELVIIGIK